MPLVTYGTPRLVVLKDDDDWAWSARLQAKAERDLQRAFTLYRQRILDAMEALGDVQADRVMDLLPWDDARDELLGSWRGVMRGLLLATGENQVRALKLPSAAFSLDNPFATDWLKNNGSMRITWVETETKLAVRAIIHDAVENHETVREVARDIQRSGKIGLRPDQLVASARYAADLESSGVGGQALDRAVAAYDKKLLRQRSMLIARTETMEGLNEGTRQAWKTAVDRNYLSPDAQRKWVAGAETDNKGRKRTCPVCLSFGGKTAPMDGEYEVGNLTSKGPPKHPNCRCSEVIIS